MDAKCLKQNRQQKVQFAIMSDSEIDRVFVASLSRFQRSISEPKRSTMSPTSTYREVHSNNFYFFYRCVFCLSHRLCHYIYITAAAAAAAAIIKQHYRYKFTIIVIIGDGRSQVPGNQMMITCLCLCNVQTTITATTFAFLFDNKRKMI